MEKDVKDIIDGIAKKFSPEKIILFGSRARGDNRKDSDVDLLVLMKDLKSRHGLTAEMYKSIERILPMDVLVQSTERFNELKSNKYMVYYYIDKEGIVVYE